MKKLVTNKLIQMYMQSRTTTHYLKKYVAYLFNLLEDIDYLLTEKIVRCFYEARKCGSTIFFIGNGGSAATASHFAQDLAECGRKSSKRSFKTCSLSDGVSFITALANDYGYEHIFSKQLLELFKEKDVLVAISASGNSPNIINAVKCAKQLKGITIGLVGFDGGKLANMCDYVLQVKTKHGEYGPVEDVHLVLGHMITSFITMHLKESNDL